MKSNWFKKRVSQASDLPRLYEDTHLNILKRAKEKVSINNSRLTDFATLDYLSLQRGLQTNYNKRSKEYGHSLSICRTRMKTMLEYSLEMKFNILFKGYHATLFQNTHLAVLGLLPLCASGVMPNFGAGDKIVMLYCNKAHQCIKITRDIVSKISFFEYVDSKDISLIKDKLEYYTNRDFKIILVADSVGSMGDVFPVRELINLTKVYQNFFIIFDDSQGMSIYGEKGCGYVLDCLNGDKNHNIIVVASLHKGFGATGTVILTPTLEQKKIIQSYATTYTFSGPLSNTDLVRISDCLDFHLEPNRINSLQRRLWSNVDYFHLLSNYCSYSKYGSKAKLPYAMILYKDENKAIELWNKLFSAGFSVICVSYPTVPKGYSGLRISFHAGHKKKDIKKLCKKIEEFNQAYALEYIYEKFNLMSTM
jgi:7-keto-8-aminopelargonate synthetase-like enzyme